MCLSIGISKKELLNDYYLEEIGEVLYEHNEIHRLPDKEEKKEEISGFDFFGF